MPIPNPDVDRPSTEPLLPPFQRGFFLGPATHPLQHPLVNLGWQLLTCTSALSFVIILASHGEIPLSDALASLISQYQTETTLFATLVATILSVTTAWFFHAAVRQAVVPFLSQRVSLFQLCSAIEFSMGSFVLNKCYARWTVLTLLCAGLLGSLTSAWSSIITPVTINLDVQVTGQEVDFGTLAAMHLMNLSPAVLQSPKAESDALLMSNPEYGIYDEGIMTAGINSVIGGLGYTSIMSLTLHGAYNISTGGIIPINNPMIPAIEAYSSEVYGSVYPQVTPLGGSDYHGLSSNQTLTQQGLTAIVSCQPQNLSETTSFPYIVLSSSTSNISALHSKYAITSWSWNTTCSDNVFSLAKDVFTLSNPQTDSNFSFLAGSVCPLQSFSGPSNKSFLITLQDYSLPSYSGSHLCEVTPLLTMVQVAYEGSIINIENILNSSTFDEIDPSGLMVFFIGRFIGWQIYAAQGLNIVGNTMLDGITGLFTSSNTSLDKLNWTLIHEDYLRGAVEGLITQLRLNVTGRLSEIPTNASRLVGGIMRVTTKGWKFSMLGDLIALLPIILTFLLSVLALLLPWTLQRRALIGSPPNNVAEHIVFDPSSIASIIRASAAGGLSHSLQGLGGAAEPAKDKDAHFLSIGLTHDNKIGFVESETLSFDIPHPHAGEAASLARNLEKITYGPFGLSIMGTGTGSAPPAVGKDEDDPNLEKMG